MALNEQQVRGLVGHIGYGNPDAPLWFVGAEEGLGGATSETEDQQNPVARCTWAPIMDMETAHRTLIEGGRYIDISSPRVGHTGVWQWMAKIARAFEGKRDFSDTNLANGYVRAPNGLGRQGATTFLTELSPFPSKTSRQPAPLTAFGNPEFIQQLLSERRRRQLELIRTGTRKCVICYGGSKRDEFAAHFGIAWRELQRFPWVSSSGMARTTAVYHAELTDGRGTSARFFMLPFLGSGAMSSDVLRQFVDSRKFQECRSF